MPTPSWHRRARGRVNLVDKSSQRGARITVEETYFDRPFDWCVLSGHGGSMSSISYAD